MSYTLAYHVILAPSGECLWSSSPTVNRSSVTAVGELVSGLSRIVSSQQHQQRSEPSNPSSDPNHNLTSEYINNSKHGTHSDHHLPLLTSAEHAVFDSYCEMPFVSNLTAARNNQQQQQDGNKYSSASNPAPLSFPAEAAAEEGNDKYYDDKREYILSVTKVPIGAMIISKCKGGENFNEFHSISAGADSLLGHRSDQSRFVDADEAVSRKSSALQAYEDDLFNLLHRTATTVGSGGLGGLSSSLSSAPTAASALSTLSELVSVLTTLCGGGINNDAFSSYLSSSKNNKPSGVGGDAESSSSSSSAIASHRRQIIVNAIKMIRSTTVFIGVIFGKRKEEEVVNGSRHNKSSIRRIPRVGIPMMVPLVQHHNTAAAAEASERGVSGSLSSSSSSLLQINCVVDVLLMNNKQGEEISDNTTVIHSAAKGASFNSSSASTMNSRRSVCVTVAMEMIQNILNSSASSFSELESEGSETNSDWSGIPIARALFLASAATPSMAAIAKRHQNKLKINGIISDGMASMTTNPNNNNNNNSGGTTPARSTPPPATLAAVMAQGRSSGGSGIRSPAGRTTNQNNTSERQEYLSFLETLGDGDGGATNNVKVSGSQKKSSNLHKSTTPPPPLALLAALISIDEYFRNPDRITSRQVLGIDTVGGDYDDDDGDFGEVKNVNDNVNIKKKKSKGMKHKLKKMIRGVVNPEKEAQKKRDKQLIGEALESDTITQWTRRGGGGGVKNNSNNNNAPSSRQENGGDFASSTKKVGAQPASLVPVGITSGSFNPLAAPPSHISNDNSPSASAVDANDVFSSSGDDSGDNEEGGGEEDQRQGLPPRNAKSSTRACSSGDFTVLTKSLLENLKRDFGTVMTLISKSQENQKSLKTQGLPQPGTMPPALSIIRSCSLWNHTGALGSISVPLIKSPTPSAVSTSMSNKRTSTNITMLSQQYREIKALFNNYADLGEGVIGKSLRGGGGQGTNKGKEGHRNNGGGGGGGRGSFFFDQQDEGIGGGAGEDGFNQNLPPASMANTNRNNISAKQQQQQRSSANAPPPLSRPSDSSAVPHSPHIVINVPMHLSITTTTTSHSSADAANATRTISAAASASYSSSSVEAAIHTAVSSLIAQCLSPL